MKLYVQWISRSGALMYLSSASLATEGAVKGANIEPLSVGNILTTVGALAIVLGILMAAAWLLRRSRLGLGSTSGPIDVVAQQALGVKERVLLLHVAGQNILVGSAGGQLRKLHSWEGERPIASHPSTPAFGDQLQRQLSRSLFKRGQS